MKRRRNRSASSRRHRPASLCRRHLQPWLFLPLFQIHFHPHSSPQHLHVHTMIRGYVQSRSPVDAAMRYLDMLNSGVAANNYTFPPLIKACAILHHDSKRIGCLVHAHVIEFGFADAPFVVSALVEFYSMILDMRTARMLFDRMSRRDVVLWTTMIDGYGKMGDVGNARDLFDHMPERNTNLRLLLELRSWH